MSQRLSPPNLFTFATSELSQDAFICWLLSWADPDLKKMDEALHKTGERFLKSLIAKHEDNKKQVVFPITSIEVKDQYKHIDVFALIEDKNKDTFGLIIEDKVGTGVHSNQLERYYEKITQNKETKYKVDDEYLYPIYLNTHNISHSMIPDSDRYREFYRADFLDVLKDYNGCDSILNNFHDHLLKLEKETTAFKDPITYETTEEGGKKTTTISPWKGKAWEGFFMALKEQLGVGNWRYVNNPSGGFHGYYFGGVPFYTNNKEGINEDVGKIYILLQRNTLGIEIGLKPDIYHGENKTTVRRRIRNRAYRYLKENLNYKLRRPERFGNGADMTLLIYGEYRSFTEENIINMPKTVETLKEISNSLKTISEKIKENPL